MAGMLYKVFRYLDLPVEEVQLSFKDSAKIDASFTKAVSANVNLNIIRGSSEKTGVYFYPKRNATIGHASAFLYRMVAAIDLLKPVEEPAPVPTPENPTPPPVNTTEYQLDTVVNGQLVKGKKYTSFDAALKAWSGGNQVITRNDKIIRMNSGMAVTKGYTVIYNEDKRNSSTYTTTDSELQYISSDNDWVHIKLAGREGYVKQSDVNLLPYTMINENRAYYEVRDGEIRHSIYNHSTKTRASYVMGPAPSFLTPGKRYYSWDGVKFIDTNSVVAGEGYNYYQFLPVRSKTNYTAEEINEYIYNKLATLELSYNLNPNNSTLTRYKDATKKSKLLGMGEYLKKVEEQYNVNALMILALAQHESQYGLSAHAQTYNNLFGLYVYDTNPANKDFVSVEANIQELIQKFWNKNYIPPNAAYANGAVFGNKMMGFNVKYASDPYWGAKAAGHYYQIDKALGFKDVTNAYRIGITTTTGLNVRTGPSVNNAVAYQYKSSNMPVILYDTSINGWAQVSSDLVDPSPVYISNTYIKELNIVK